MLVNEKIYNIDLSDNLYLSKIKNIIPITVSFIPRLEYRGKQYPISRIIKIIEDKGADFLIENCEPTVAFSLFRESDEKVLKSIFLNDMNAFKRDFATPVLQNLLNIIGGERVIENLLIENIFFEIRDVTHGYEFIEYMTDGINSIFKMLNDHINEVDEWCRDTYDILGEIWQLNYIYSRMKSPDLILDFDNKLCGVFRTEIATTYYLPNGL